MPANLADETMALDALRRQYDGMETQPGQARTLGAHLLASTLHHPLAA